VLLAADLPLLTAVAVERLVAALESSAGLPPAGASPAGPSVGAAAVDGAVYVDDAGRPQWLCGAWRSVPLRRRLDAMAGSGPVAGRALRELFGPARVAHVLAAVGEPPPWYDCDTPEQARVAEELGRSAGQGLDDEIGGAS
jgi:molybdopterin-guanine dinucleotide biosynthesis protein A